MALGYQQQRRGFGYVIDCISVFRCDPTALRCGLVAGSRARECRNVSNLGDRPGGRSYRNPRVMAFVFSEMLGLFSVFFVFWWSRWGRESVEMCRIETVSLLREFKLVHGLPASKRGVVAGDSGEQRKELGNPGEPKGAG